MAEKRSRACVVVGGRGFVGKLLVKQLLSSTGDDAWDVVRVMDIAPSMTLSEDEKACPVTTAALASGRLVYVSGDVTKLEDVQRACAGTYAVFHMASPSPELDNFKVHYRVNVTGAKNVIQACLTEGVRALVYTSSASVVFDGNHDLKGIDESYPYATKHMSVYGETKAHAEALVLAANGHNALLRTCALRPSNIFGPGDLVLTPAVARNAAAGKLKFVIGDGTAEADWTFVDNVVHGHICAERALRGDEQRSSWEASGKAYFITNMDPMPIFGFLLALAAALGYKVNVVAKIPASVILPVSYAAEFVYKTLKPLGLKPSDFTPFRMKILTRWKVYSCQQAKRLLGYTPQVVMKDAIQRTADANPHLKAGVLDIKS